MTLKSYDASQKSDISYNLLSWQTEIGNHLAPDADRSDSVS
jgi:hypothetical protein